MLPNEVGEKTRVLPKYKEYRALVDKIFTESMREVKVIARDTNVEPRTVQRIINESEMDPSTENDDTYYAQHTQEQIKTMVIEKTKHYEKESHKNVNHDVIIARLRGQLSNPNLLESANHGVLTDLTSSLVDIPVVPDHIIGEIVDESLDVINERLHKREQAVMGDAITDQELREWSGVLDPKGTADVKIAALEATSNEYRLKALREGEPRKERIYKNISDTAELKIDLIYLVEKGEAPEHDEAQSILRSVVENNESVQDLSRLERLKAWFKENWLGASALAITVASLLTTIIVGLRSVAKSGAGATKSFAVAVRDAIKKLGPWAAPLAALAYFLANGGGKVLSWVANNLWFVVLLVVVYIYYKYRKR